MPNRESIGAGRQKKLTIAIPTFGRKDQLLPRLESMLAGDVADVAEILVLDDGSRDGTVAALIEAGLHERVHLVASETNRGYARTFIDVLRHCRTEFALLSADDDDVLDDGVVTLADQLQTETAHLIATVYLQDGVRQRAHGKRGSIRPWELRPALNLAPGVVYRIPTAQAYLSAVEQRLEKGCSMAQLYPQVVLGTHIALRHESRWSPIATIAEGANLPTGIRDVAGRDYASAPSRLQQAMDYDALLVDLIAQLDDQRHRRYARGLLGHHRRTAFGQVRHQVEQASLTMAIHLELGAIRSLVLRPLRLVRDQMRARRR